MNCNSYELMIPPLDKYEFEEFNKQEAQLYFEWYINQSDKRINLLKSYCETVTNKSNMFDGTVASLRPVWKWFESQIESERKSDEEIAMSLVGKPIWLQEELKKHDWKLSLATCALAIDLSFYFAAVFTHNNPSISWGYYTKPKSLVYVNRPVLTGFANKVCLDPRMVILNCCRRSFSEKKPDRLFELYVTWSKLI